MAIGYLTIQARTAHDALPLSGASIRILNAQGTGVYLSLIHISEPTRL